MSSRLNEGGTLLELIDVHKTFSTRGTTVRAVDGVSLTLERGKTTALVGESGSGKSTLSRLILHLHKADSGRIVFDGQDVQDLKESAFRPLRKRIQMVFQNPLTAFDPAHTIGASIKETLRLDPVSDPDARVAQVLTDVGLTPRFAGLRPRDVSGGELQRAGIARALSVTPDLVVMDEPTSALDMSIQGQVLGLVRELQARHELTYLIVTHDLRAVRLIADRVAVMYHGKLVEHGPTAQVFAEPREEYTRKLLAAHDLPSRSEKSKERA